jgi:hypothetical protein
MPVVLKFITTPKVKIPEHPNISTIFYYRTYRACMSRIFRKQEIMSGAELYIHIPKPLAPKHYLLSILYL